MTYAAGVQPDGGFAYLVWTCSCVPGCDFVVISGAQLYVLHVLTLPLAICLSLMVTSSGVSGSHVSQQSSIWDCNLSCSLDRAQKP